MIKVEEAIREIKNMAKFNYTLAPAEVFDMAVKALKQESVLNNIRAEIADIYCGQYCENPLTPDEVKEIALEIIDKYKEKSED